MTPSERGKLSHAAAMLEQMGVNLASVEMILGEVEHASLSDVKKGRAKLNIALRRMREDLAKKKDGPGKR